MFCIRLYLNDLYVSIPDRLLITCALAQTLHNIPVEALIAEGNMWEASPYLKFLDDLSKFTLISSFFLFWLIYTKDKVSWEKMQSKSAIFTNVGLLVTKKLWNPHNPAKTNKVRHFIWWYCNLHFPTSNSVNFCQYRYGRLFIEMADGKEAAKTYVIRSLFRNLYAKYGEWHSKTSSWYFMGKVTINRRK